MELLQDTPEMGISTFSVIKAFKKVFKDQLGIELYNRNKKEFNNIVLVKKNAEKIVEYIEQNLTCRLSRQQELHLKHEFQFIEAANFSSSLKHGEMDKSFFSKMQQEVKAKCPLIHQIFSTLIDEGESQDAKIHTGEMKMRKSMFVLGSLSHIRSMQTDCDISKTFGLLAVSHGAGSQFINMLSRMGLSLHWNTLMDYMSKFQSDVMQKVKDTGLAPVIIGHDNVNIYQNVQHARFDKGKPQMLNMDARCLIIPNLDGLATQISDAEASLKSQKDIKDVTVEDILIENNPELKNIWESKRRHYLLSALQEASKLPDMSRSPNEMKNWIKSTECEECINGKPKINVVNNNPTINLTPCIQSEVIVLPLINENPAGKVEMAKIMNQFTNELSIPKICQKYLPYNEKLKSYDLKGARERFSFLQTVQSVEVDKPRELEFNSLYETLARINKLQINAVDYLKDRKAEWSSITNHQKQSLVHIAVENNNISLVKCMIAVGVDINVIEGCGATPLVIATIFKNKKMVELLCENGAEIEGPLFQHIQTPVEIAKSIGDDDITDLLISFQSNNQEDLQLDFIFQGLETLAIDDTAAVLNANPDNTNTTINNSTGYSRSNGLTVSFGDVGTTKMQRSIKNADPNGFKHFTEFPGDLHAGAYIEECFAQVHGPTGFYHIAQSVLNQKKVNPASFAKDKLKDGNLQRNKEVGMTIRWAYTISACYEFLKINKLDQKLPLEEFSDQLYTDLITFLKKGKLQKQHHCDVALFWGHLKILS